MGKPDFRLAHRLRKAVCKGPERQCKVSDDGATVLLDRVYMVLRWFDSTVGHNVTRPAARKGRNSARSTVLL